MANIQSQKKRNRQNERRHERNKAVRSEIKTRIRNALTAAESGDAAAAQDALRLAQKRIDKAAASGVLKKNTAARRKSQLTRQVTDLLAS
jgi:small subunit ribosomal protein S20